MTTRGTLDPGENREDAVRAAFGRWIRNHRQLLGLSQAGLQRRLASRGVQVSQSAISRWETGDASPPLETLPALAGCLGATLASAEEVLARAARAAPAIDLTGRSADDLRREGDRAARAGNFHRALALYEAAHDLLRLGDTSPAPGAEASVLLPLAWVHYNLWHLELARDILRRLAHLPGLPPPVMLRRHLLRVVLEHRYGDHESASILAADAERRLDSLAGEDRAFACHTLGHFYYSASVPRKAAPLLEEAVAGWEEVGQEPEAVRARAFLGYCVAASGDREKGESVLGEALQQAETRNYRDVVIQTARLLGRVLAEGGHVEEGLVFLENSMMEARRAALPEEEFLGGFHSWRFLEGEARERQGRRLRRLLPLVHPLLPEAQTFRDICGNDPREQEATR